MLDTIEKAHYLFIFGALIHAGCGHWFFTCYFRYSDTPIWTDLDLARNTLHSKIPSRHRLASQPRVSANPTQPNTHHSSDYSSPKQHAKTQFSLSQPTQPAVVILIRQPEVPIRQKQRQDKAKAKAKHITPHIWQTLALFHEIFTQAGWHAGRQADVLSSSGGCEF